MAAQATLAINGGPTFNFVTAKTGGGRIPDYPIAILEDISVDGIDFARRRLNAKRFRPFTVATMAEETDYGTAIITARNYEKAIGFLAKLTTIIRGITYTYQVMVLDVSAPQIMAGAPFGVNVSSGKTSGIIAQWTLEVVTITAFAQ